MRVKKNVLMLIIFALLIGGGVWLGVHLMQKNSQPVMAIAVLRQSDDFDLLLTTNKKDKIISIEILNDDLKDCVNVQRVVGENIEEFFKTYIKDFDECKILIFGREHNHVLRAKKAINKQYEIEQKNVNFETYTAQTNCQTKYESVIRELKIDDFDDLNENKILQEFVKNSQNAIKKGQN